MPFETPPKPSPEEAEKMEKDQKEKEKIEIVEPIDTKKRSKEEIEKSKQIQKEIEREKIRKRYKKGELLSARELAEIGELELEKKYKKPKTEIESEKELPKEKLLQELDEKRRIYIEQDKIFKLAKEKEETGWAIKKTELEKAKSEYEKVKSEYARKLYLEKIEQLRSLGINEQDPRFKQEMNLFIASLFEDFVLREQDRLAKEKVDELEPRKRTWFRKMIASYARMPMWKKVLISSGIVTGYMVAGGGIGGVGAAVAFGGYRFVRGMLGGKLAMLSCGLVKAMGTRRIEEYRQREIEGLKQRFATEIESISQESEFQRMFRDRCREYEKIVKEVNKRHNRITKWSLAAGVAVGGTTAAGLMMTNLDGPLSDPINQKLGFVETSSIEAPSEVPPEAPSEVPPEAPSEVPPEVAPEVVKSVVEIQKGDSVWKILEHQLEARYSEEFTSLTEAKKTYIIDALKDKIAENPEKFNLEDINKLKVGQKIDLSPIFEDKADIENIFDKAEGLHQKQINNIEHNNQILKNWLKEHPGESLTSEKIEKILSSSGEVAPVEEVVEIPEEEVAEIPEEEVAEIPEEVAEGPSELEEPAGEKMEKIMKLNETSNIQSIGFTEGEYNAIKNITVEKLLKEIPEGEANAWKLWREKPIEEIDLPHHGVYGFIEYSKQIKLAEFIRSFNPGDAIKKMTIRQFLRMVGPNGTILL